MMRKLFLVLLKVSRGAYRPLPRQGHTRPCRFDDPDINKLSETQRRIGHGKGEKFFFLPQQCDVSAGGVISAAVSIAVASLPGRPGRTCDLGPSKTLPVYGVVWSSWRPVESCWECRLVNGGTALAAAGVAFMHLAAGEVGDMRMLGCCTRTEPVWIGEFARLINGED
jgi:hypothetical protein